MNITRTLLILGSFFFAHQALGLAPQEQRFLHDACQAKIKGLWLALGKSGDFDMVKILENERQKKYATTCNEIVGFVRSSMIADHEPANFREAHSDLQIYRPEEQEFDMAYGEIIKFILSDEATNLIRTPEYVRLTAARIKALLYHSDSLYAKALRDARLSPASFMQRYSPSRRTPIDPTSPTELSTSAPSSSTQADPIQPTPALVKPIPVRYSFDLKPS